MSRKKSTKKLRSKIIEPIVEKQAKPRTAKIVLFVFGVGPLLLMCLFLFSNGFFSSPWAFRPQAIFIVDQKGVPTHSIILIFFFTTSFAFDRYINHLFCVSS